VAKKLALATLVATAIVIGALALWEMREAVQLLLISIAISAALRPGIAWMTKRGLARSHAIAAMFLLVLGGLIVCIILLGTQIGADLALAADELPAWYEQRRLAMLNGISWERAVGAMLPSVVGLTDPLVGEDSAALGNMLIGLVGQVTVASILVVSVTSLGFYWMQEQQRIERLWLSLLPLRWRTLTRELWNETYDELGVYVISVVASVALTALGLTLILLLLGVPGATTIALVGGVLQIIPLVGPLMAILAAGLLGFAISPLTGALALAGATVVVGLVRFVAVPRLQRRGAPVNPLLTVFVLMALAELGGPELILLGPPLAAAIQEAVRVLRAERQSDSSTETREVIELRTRLEEVAALVQPDQENAARVQDMIGRTRRLMDELPRLRLTR
jgi:predicted PurR-regulated permease PerM